ncbi:serine hydrolase domain-containing protein [Thalassotalea fonticola]|uniref:Serine hydrolase domain-containing protein n=1 Tax=Thalassotalea fonticola TaxID=3065649 RepID=A0ABZ0GL41_9GAMM|nr:serine hydrolase domain-containing protein [Colwelliaceae bacterium S1-1]
MTSNYNFKSKLLCTSIALLLTACGGSSGDKKPQISEVQEVITMDYQQIIDETVSDTIPGIILLVESPEKRFLGSAGVENIATQNPMQIYHTMPTASAGKPMIGLLAAMLADDNLLDLDDTIDTWLSDDILNQIPNSAAMTLRQLLNHTSGIYNYTENEGYLDLLISDPDKVKTDIDFLVFALNQPAHFKPGDSSKYSNTGYLLAGLIMDQVLGMHHSIALRERILVPLGMDATYYIGIEKDQGDFISGYHQFDDHDTTYETKSYLENISEASSPVVSSVEDMALFMKSVAAEQSFINDSIRNDFVGTLPNHSNGVYGLGINVDPIGDNTAYYHAGLDYGYHTQNIYIKEKGLSITAFMNCSTAPVCERTMDSLIKKVIANELY